MIERICIISLASLVFFYKAFSYKYSSDDIPASMRPKNPNKWLQWFYVLEGQARSTPQIDRLITTLLHTFASIGVYLGFGASDASFLAGLLFLVNPANNQGSVWIAGRGYVFASIGMTWAMAFPFLAFPFLLIATYNNAGFVAPLIFGASSYWYFLLLLPIAWLFHYKRFKVNVADKIKQEMYAEDKQIKWQKLVLATKTFGYYTFHALIPRRNSFYHAFLQSVAGCMKDKGYSFCHWFYLGLALIISIITYWICTPWTLASFGLLWWVFCLLPFLNFFRIHQEIAERYMYLPNVGLMYFIATFLVNYPILAAVLGSIYATKMWFYMDAYRDDYFLVEMACLNSPDAWFGWHVRAMKRWDAKSHTEAFILWAMARNISPKEFKLNLNIATALALSTNPAHREEAKQFIKIAADNIPKGQENQAQPLIDKWHKGEYTIVL